MTFHPNKIKSLYDAGVNVSKHLREEFGDGQITEPMIEIVYDIQAGVYIDRARTINRDYLNEYGESIAEILGQFGKSSSIAEAGVGEATTLTNVIKHIGWDSSFFGFDISWSRVAYANTYLNENKINNAKLCSGSLLNIPYRNESIGTVYTSHSIEPNGGAEELILKELYRVARDYIVMLEPAFELGSDEARARMKSLGYCRGLPSICKKLGYDVVEHRLFEVTRNPLNPTALTIIKKQSSSSMPDTIYRCPRHGDPLAEAEHYFYSKDSMTAYPVLKGVPCLREENGIIATKLPFFE